MNKVAWASILAILLASLWSLSYRYKVEASNKAVGVLIEGQVVSDFSAATGRSRADILSELQNHGLTGVALTEENVGDMIDQRELVVENKQPFGVTIKGGPESLARMARAVARRGGLGSSPGQLNVSSMNFDGDIKSLRSTSAGVDPYEAAAVREAGLALIVRHANVMGADPSYIHDLLQESKDHGTVAFLAAGEQVLGQREAVEDMAHSLEVLGMSYLTPEFSKIAGDARAASFNPSQTIRLHSMQQPEVDKATPAAIVDRYKLAFRERNIRWLLVRPVTFGGQDPVLAFGRTLESLKAGIASEGGAIKPPRPFDDPKVPRLAFLLIGLAAVPMMIFVASRFLNGILKWIAFAAVLALGAGAWVESVRPFTALAIAVSGPLAAYVLWLESQKKPVWVWYLLMSGISLTAGLAVSGLLNSLEYLIQIKQVLGVKAILFGPVVLVGWYLAKNLWSPKELGKSTITWGQAGLALVIGGAFFLLFVRSGNDSPAAVSELELKIRALLDRFLYTRPRTKEFLLGHPALILGLITFNLKDKGRQFLPLAVVLLTLGAIGQADIVDTLCHTHTPLDIGLARVGIGLVLGGIIGALAWLPTRALTKRLEGT